MARSKIEVESLENDGPDVTHRYGCGIGGGAEMFSCVTRGLLMLPARRSGPRAVTGK